MAFLLGCEELSIEFPGKTLLDHMSIGINDGDCVGIVGRNGDGKSTLLSLIAGTMEPDEGQVTHRHGLRIGYLQQTDAFSGDETVEQAIFGTLPKHEWASDPKIRGILAGLVSELEGTTPIRELSGGQRRRVDLARVLVEPCDLLLLDEPTNHLDIVSIRWLAEHLKTRMRPGNGALLVVTHDRWFLDEVCTSMWEVHDGGVEPFEGGFSAYVLQRVQRDEAAIKAEQKRQNQLRRELAWLSRGARARATKPKFHMETAKALIADVPELRNPIELKRTAVARLGKQVIDLFDVTCGYEGITILDNVTWGAGAGDRFGILGVNGAGKTTLINLVRGTLAPTSGRVRIGTTVKMATLTQYLDELEEHRGERVRDVIKRYKTSYVVDGKELTPAQLLERLGFAREELSTPVEDLSGGQRRRLQLLLTLLQEPNVLILDEPGNDMDTDMLAVMEDLLDSWPGTLLLVTHDRYLMERVTDDQYALLDGKIVHMPGGVEQYLDIATGKREAPILMESPRSSGKTPPPAPEAENVAAQEVPRKMSGGEFRDLKKRIASCERKIATQEDKEAQARQALADTDPTDYLALSEAQAAIDEVVARREELEMTWLELTELLEGVE